MAFFMVSYDLRKKAEFDYQKLWDAFSDIDSVKFQESAYFLDANNTIAEVRDHFANLVHADDLLMIVEFTQKPRFTKALPGTSAWVNGHWP